MLSLLYDGVTFISAGGSKNPGGSKKWVVNIVMEHSLARTLELYSFFWCLTRKKAENKRPHCNETETLMEVAKEGERG